MKSDIPSVEQALVLIGGKASRLRASGYSLESSKAFIQVAGKPLLYWNLKMLHSAGIHRLVIAADTSYLLFQANKIIRSLPVKFIRVNFFQDEGNGVHGIPYELRYLLDETFLFECGHSFSKPEHYSKLIRCKVGADVVFSAYTAHPKNSRQPVALRDGRVYEGVDNSHSVIAHPIVANQEYASSLLRLKFNIYNIIAHYTDLQGLKYIANDLPVEFDNADELWVSIHIYEQYLARVAII
ncbi:MAG: NTP transferase domain-containing protein [Methylophilus sp.]|jgi:molybdopterin-guanine dinucleotide biosynthesis protein A